MYDAASVAASLSTAVVSTDAALFATRTATSTTASTTSAAALVAALAAAALATAALATAPIPTPSRWMHPEPRSQLSLVCTGRR